MKSDSVPVLRAGASRRDITPQAGVHLAGSGTGVHRPAQTVIDPLLAKAVVLEAGDRRVVMVTLDVTIITTEYTTRIRRQVSGETGIPAEAILIHAIQTHSAPSVGHFLLDPDFPLETTPANDYLRGGCLEYADFASAQAAEAAIEAARRLQPARIGYGRALVDGLAFNRRGLRRDGVIMMPKPRGRANQPLGITELCYLEGPVDPEVGVVCLQDESMRPIACLLHFTCHPVNLFGNPQTFFAVSPDWPGAWTQQLLTALGQDCVPLVLNGCCGNINPWNPFDPEDTPDHWRMGRALGETTLSVLQAMKFAASGEIDFRQETVELPFRDIPATRLQEVADILAQHPQPLRQQNGEVAPRWVRAASTRSVEICKQREGALTYPIQVMRIGDLALIGLPGEPFVEGQLALKTESPAPFVQVAHCCTEYVGYLPTRAAYQRFGHEANEDVTYWAKLAPGCLETVVDQARQMVAELWP